MSAPHYLELAERLEAREDPDSEAAAAAIVALVEDLQAVVSACQAGRWYEAGPGGMTIEAQIARTRVNGVAAAPVVRAEDTLAFLLAAPPELWREYLKFAR